MTGILMGTPKYACGNCGKMFSIQKGLYRHTSKNRCGSRKTTSKTMTLVEIRQEYPEQQTTQYYGSEYNYSGLATGNRHLRAGIPLPRLSKYARAAI